MSNGNQNNERTCAVCRQARSRRELLDLGESGGTVTLERPGKGRGAHVCISHGCLSQLDTRTLSRAFKKHVRLAPPLDGEGFLASLHALAERRVLESLGLARRQGDVRLGVDRAAEMAEGDVLVAASDLAPRSARAMDRAGAQPFVDSGVIGRAVGAGSVGAVSVRDGRLARQADYWLRVWRESGEDRSVPARTGDHGARDSVLGRAPGSKGEGPEVQTT